MRILLTNDDGIYAPGLKVLENIARSLSDDVWVIAPASEQSGAAHSLTLHRPIRVQELGPQRFSVSGTPTDCVLMGLYEILKGKPDLILSGVNSGTNIGGEVTYSGTVSAAMEGTIMGIPSIALSLAQEGLSPMDWSVPETYGPQAIQGLLHSLPWPERVLINVNFPIRVSDVSNPFRIVGLGFHHWSDRDTAFIQANNPRSNDYYWVGPAPIPSNPLENSDQAAIAQGLITITPVHLDLTAWDFLPKLQASFQPQ